VLGARCLLGVLEGYKVRYNLFDLLVLIILIIAIEGNISQNNNFVVVNMFGIGTVSSLVMSIMGITGAGGISGGTSGIL